LTDIAARPSTIRSRASAARPVRYAERYMAEAADLVAPLSSTFQPDDFAPAKVNFRWLIGATLTALFGTTLIGSVVHYSLNRTQSLIEMPEIAFISESNGSGEGAQTPTKGDRLVVLSDIASARQSFRAAISVTVGDHDVVKMRPFVKVATNLTLSSIGFSADIPPFEPMKLFGGADNAEVPQLEIRASEEDTDLSLQKSQLSATTGDFEAAAVLSPEQIDAQVEEARKAALSLGKALPLSIGGQQFLTRTLPNLTGAPTNGGTTSLDTAFSSIQISVVPENVTALPKKPPVPTAARTTSDERILVLRKNEQPEQALLAAKLPAAAARAAAAVLMKDIKDVGYKEGEKLRVLLSLPPDQKAEPRLLRVILYDGDTIVAIAAIDDRGQFVSVAPPSSEGTIGADEQPDADPNESKGFRLYDSLYETALKNDIPKPVIDQLVRIYFYDVDLQRKVAGGDSFEVFYAEDEENAGRYEVLYAALSVSGVTKRYYQYKSPDDGSIDYFDEQGKSNRKFLMRKPITEGIFRSGFGMRYHPILHVSRLHSGVDWANSVGTPILAAGDGVVTFADWDTGYGRHIEIQHAYDFTTTYSHMSAFAKGITEGVHVRQGQVIGYLGASGLATGPHLHYEVLVKGEFKDPMAIKLPRSRELDDRELRAFKHEQDVINDIMTKAPGAVRVVAK
jgi:murein DD-endopeptidase MepM/ murein hydrolase activator NlpD